MLPITLRELDISLYRWREGNRSSVDVALSTLNIQIWSAVFHNSWRSEATITILRGELLAITIILFWAGFCTTFALSDKLQNCMYGGIESHSSLVLRFLVNKAEECTSRSLQVPPLG
jgi:hypothetical protein